MARARNFRGPGVVRRKRVWARQLTSFTAVAQSVAQISDLLAQFQADYGANAILGSTVARTYLQFSAVTSVQVSQVNGLAVGIIKAPKAADADDLSPLNAIQRHQDWSLVKTFWGDPGAAGGSSQLVAEVDLKAMRKLEELGDDYVVAFQSATSGTEWDIQMYATTLLLLP